MKWLLLCLFILLLPSLALAQRLPPGLRDNSVQERYLNAVDNPNDEECLTYETTTGNFEWQPCGAGGSSNSFETWAVPAGTNPVADSGTDTITITETSPLVITGTAATDTIDITWSSVDIGADGTIQANAVALTTDTTGNYVANANTSVLTGLTGGSAGSEGATLSLAWDYSATLAADPALAANNCVPSTTGFICEGATANISETLITLTDPTADRTFTIPDADSNPIRPLTCGGTDKVSAIAATGIITCSTDVGGGTGNSFETIAVPAGTNPVADSTTDTLTITETSPLVITGTAATDTIDITWSSVDIGSDGTIQANAVALTTDTTGNYVASITNGAGISGGDGGSEGAALTIAATLGTDIVTGEIVDATIAQVDIDDAATLAGNPAFGASSVWFATTGLIFEGLTSDINEGLLISADVTADVTWTLPNETGTVCTTGSVCTGYQAGPLTGDVVTSGAAATIQANSVALTTDTTGNYVASITNGSGITGGDGGTEGAALTIAATLGTDIVTGEIVDATIAQIDIDDTATLAGNPAFGDSSVWFATTGLIFEGATSNISEGLLISADVTADRTWTLPDETGTFCTTGAVCSGYQAGPLTGDVVTSGAAATIQANSVALTTDTTGNYVASANTSALTGLTGGSAGSEGAALSLAWDYSATLAGNPGLGAGVCVPSTTGFICEGATADTIETLITLTDPATSDRTFTIPNADSNPVQPLTCSGTDKVSAISSAGVITCAADQTSAGGGDPVLIDGTDITDASGVNLIGGAGLDYTLNAAVSPDTATAAVDATELNDLTFGDDTDATIQWTFNQLTGTDPIIQFDGGTVNVSTGTLQEGGVAVSLPARTETLTNKTLDVEGTGNVITTVSKIWIPVAQCQNTTAGLLLDTETTNPPVAACITGTNTQKGVADFDPTTDQCVQVSVQLPADFTGNIDARYVWLAAATTGSTGWCSQLVSTADAETDDAAFPAQGAGNCVSDAAKGTANQVNQADDTAITATGVAAGELLHIRLCRDANGSAVTDDMTGNARLIGVEYTFRRAE